MAWLDWCAVGVVWGLVGQADDVLEKLRKRIDECLSVV